MPSLPVKIWFLWYWILIEFCISFFMVKYSKFTDNIGSGNFTNTFYQNTEKFKKSWVGGGVRVLHPYCPPLNTLLGEGELIEYVRKGLIWKPFEDTINLNSEIILSEITVKNNKWATFSVYRPPSNSNIETFLGDLWSILNKYLSKYVKIIIMGDFDIDVKNKANPNFNNFLSFAIHLTSGI